jgi:nicotinamidase-related amidase
LRAVVLAGHSLLAAGRSTTYRSLVFLDVERMPSVKRIDVDNCCGALIDYQDFFLAQAEPRHRSRLKADTRHFVRLLGYFRIPIVATVERPVSDKGSIPKELRTHLGNQTKIFEKDFFDLTKEKPIRTHLAKLKKKQVIVAGCETDVCVLQSCLGLLDLGYEVYAVEEILFSSAHNTDAAVVRMRAEGVVFLSYKTLFYELIAAVDGGPHGDKVMSKFGLFPDDIPDVASR